MNTKMTPKLKKRFNKKAQETLASDLFISFFIIIIITISMFVISLIGDNKIEKINANLVNIREKRELLTLLKMPTGKDMNIGDMLVQHYGSDPATKEELSGKLGAYMDVYYEDQCFWLGAKVKDETVFTFDNCLQANEAGFADTDTTAYLPLPTEDVIEVHMRTCTCSRKYESQETKEDRDLRYRTIFMFY